MTNVVLYLRYSSDKQTEQSIEGQDRVCRDYCARNDMNVVGVYIDRALSASKNTEKRDEFQRMIRDSERATWEAVVVYKLDRFARNRYDSATYKNRLKKNGVRVISATENISDNPEGIILESVLEGMAEFYSRELAQKVTRGMHETALKGNSCGGAIPLGYKIENKKFVLDPLTAPIVAEAFERYANGETVTEICQDFNKRKLRTNKGAEFNKNSFKNVFKNERYLGIYTYKDVRIEGGMPAIVTREVFDKVQRRLHTNAQSPGRGKGRTDYLLTGKLFCGHCGTTMVGDCGTGTGGKLYHYYTCRRRRDRKCDKLPMPKDYLERIVVEDALALFTTENIERIADMAVEAAARDLAENSTVPAIEAEIKDLEKSIANLLKLAERGSTSESLFARLDELEIQKRDATTRLLEEKATAVDLDRDQLILWLTRFAQGSTEDGQFCRLVIDMLVSSVTVWDEPDGTYKITTVYHLDARSTKVVKSSDFGRDGSPKESYPKNITFYKCYLGYTTKHRAD